MRLISRGECYVAESSYEERALPKQAGFLWHGGNCRPGCVACAQGLGKVWWTKRPEAALRLLPHADAETAARLEGCRQAVESSRATDAAIDVPAPTGLEYLPYQRAGIAYALGRKNTLIGDEPGLGKTIQALGVVNADTTIGRVLVLCPASLRINWAREAGRWLVRPLAIHVVDSRDPVPSDAEVVICNYDRLVGQADLRKSLLAREWDLLVLDEAHFLKNPEAKRTQIVLGRAGRGERAATPGLVSRARRVVALTGTPIVNRPVELQPLAGALAPSEFGNFFAFAKRYCAARQVSAGHRLVWDFSGASNLSELQNRLRASILVRRLKVDVLPELPAKRRQVVVLPTNGGAAAVRAEQAAFAAVEESLADLQAEADLAHAAGDEEAYEAAVKRLRQGYAVAFTQISAVRHATALAKVDYVIEHVDGLLEAMDKVVVFAHHHDVVAKLTEHFGAAAVVLTGETPTEARQVAVDRFQTDPSVRVFVGSITAAGVGLTLTAASTVVFAELDWVPGNVTQAEDRCHRIGQRESVLVQHLVLDGSLDARIAHVIVEKQAVADKALDDSTALPVLPLRQGEAATARPKTYPVPSEEERTAARTAVRFLAGRCDGAVLEDGVGYNKIDASVGHKLAALPRLTDGQVWLAKRLARKYRKQLPAQLAAVLRVFE